MSNTIEFSKALDNCFNDIEMDAKAIEAIKKTILINFNEQVSTSKLKEKLGILFEYEKNYLGLIKEYKEEIKFVGTLQEDLRKERAKFFSDTLREVSIAMKESQVPSEVASKWIEELVNSYTKSLDISNGLIEEHTFDTIGDIRKQAKELVAATNKTSEQ